MNVFVVGTGRCGTCTFYQACKHITNYTVGHESQSNLLDFPKFGENHIEISSGLVPVIGLMNQRYPNAFWVHLVRNRKDCIRSLARQCTCSMNRFCANWFHVDKPAPLDAAELFYDSVNSLIELALKPLKSMTIKLHQAQDQWPEFWRLIGAKGDFNESQHAWTRKYNSATRRGRGLYEQVATVASRSGS